MRSADRENIRRLLKRLGRDFSTEDHITFVAENTGLLQSCRNVLAAEREGRQETIEWLKDACVENGVAYPHCLQEIGRILQLFQPGMEQDQHYAELGLTADASDEEVKRAYRRLSIKYHPDTARETDEQTTEKFIRLTRAYHAIISGEESAADPTPASRRSSFLVLREAGKRLCRQTFPQAGPGCRPARWNADCSLSGGF